MLQFYFESKKNSCKTSPLFLDTLYLAKSLTNMFLFVYPANQAALYLLFCQIAMSKNLIFIFCQILWNKHILYNFLNSITTVCEFSLGGVAPPWVWTGLPKNILSPPIEERPHKQRVVYDFKNIHENIPRLSQSLRPS